MFPASPPIAARTADCISAAIAELERPATSQPLLWLKSSRLTLQWRPQLSRRVASWNTLYRLILAFHCC